MSEQVVSMDKQYKLENGDMVRVLCIDSPDPTLPVVYCYGKGYTADAGWCDSQGRDAEGKQMLFEVRPTVKAECWLNVWADGSVASHDTKQQADACNPDRIACIHIEREVEHGEGVPDAT